MDQNHIRAELARKRHDGAALRRLGGLKQMASLFVGGGMPAAVRALVAEAYQAPLYSRGAFLASQKGKIGEKLAKLSDADWRRAIDVTLPHVASSADAALRALVRRPYQTGMARKPFRAPRSTTTLADVRGRWLIDATLLLGDYDADIRWITEHGAHLAGWSGPVTLGWLLAGAIDANDEASDDVYGILVASTSGEHPTAQVGRHATQALLSCGREDAWAHMEKLLLAAQRQEGLRQAILESVDEAHPMAFRRMLRLILNEKLSRFSSVVRAADTWFGFLWDGASSVAIEPILERALCFLEDPSAQVAALDESDAETVYLALWSMAFEDVDAAIGPAVRLLDSPSAEIRFVATHLLVQATWTRALEPLSRMLGDDDLRVAARALDMFAVEQTASVDGALLFDRLEQLLARVPKRSTQLEGLVWPWWKRKLERETIAEALAWNASKVDPARLLPHVPDMSVYQRAGFIRRAAGLSGRWLDTVMRTGSRRTMSRAERAMALDLLGDAAESVRASAFEVMQSLPLEQDEVDRLVDLLARKPGDLRTNALARLGTLPAAALLPAADRLLTDTNELRRVAGLELLRDALEKGKAGAEATKRINRYAEGNAASLTSEERAHVKAVVDEQTDVPTTDDALGLVDRASLKRWPAPRNLDVDTGTSGMRGALRSLAELVLQHQATEVRASSGEMKMLLQAAGWHFGPHRRDDVTAESSTVPLQPVWRAWLAGRRDAERDRDGLELLRALQCPDDDKIWADSALVALKGIAQYSAGVSFLRSVLEWCVAWEPPPGAPSFLLDGLETSIAALDASDYRAIVRERTTQSDLMISFLNREEPAHQRKLARADAWLRRYKWWRELFPATILPEHASRLYALLAAFATQSQGKSRFLHIGLDDYAAAYRAGVVGDNELVDLLAGPHAAYGHASLLRDASTRKPPRALADSPELLTQVDRVRRRIVEIETQRGDRVSAASALVMALRWTGGLETVALALPALVKSHFTRSFGWNATSPSRQDALSHLILRSMPREDDTAEAFAEWVRSARIKEARLVELAVYAPQWASHVNHVLEWPGLETSVWWIHAHTKDDRSWRLQELKEIWAAEVSERTPLSAADLTEGAVDVAWFHEANAQLGTARWAQLDSAAKYAASAGGHTRAQLFARAMGGLVTRDELMARIDESRHQDSVRALGLLPLAAGDERRRDLLERYLRLEAYRRESRKFGSQRQASEKRAVAIGMANLARAAGFRDPQRLQWAMEREAVGELARGPIVLTRDDVELELSLDTDGVPALRTTKKGKPLKALPAALKKDPEVAELRERLQALKKQRSRVRDALEEAMCRGDVFAGDELRDLLAHPVLAPSLARLVFVGDGVAGYLAEQGRALRDHTGRVHALGKAEEVRIAHPIDLFVRGDWSAWQRECFIAERVQPFKQLFRELYPATESEHGTTLTRRYAGHQVNPRQALALLGGRGWVAHPDEGVSRTFHEAGITARLGFQESFHTPAEIEGLTLEDVTFTRKGEWTALSLDDVPSRLFSEAMRDLDLVASVAHRGGVDPEATASTVEMRGTLVRETCELLGLTNVQLTANHALIRGVHAEYSIHLGSAMVMVLPGTAVPIVAVHSQHRGRLFLPFADDDPRTAEVLSKLLLLSRDAEIRDPSIMQWIRAAKGTSTS